MEMMIKGKGVTRVLDGQTLELNLNLSDLECLAYFDGKDLPDWMDEATGKSFMSCLNAFIPKIYSRRGTRFHLLNRYPGGRLYIHLLGRF